MKLQKENKADQFLYDLVTTYKISQNLLEEIGACYYLLVLFHNGIIQQMRIFVNTVLLYF